MSRPTALLLTIAGNVLVVLIAVTALTAVAAAAVVIFGGPILSPG